MVMSMMSNRTRNVIWFIIGVICMAMVLLGAITVVKVSEVTAATELTTSNTNDIVRLIREDQKGNVARSKQASKTSAQTAATLRQVKSCTLPKGKCFLRNQKQTAKVVASINDALTTAVAAAVAVCGRRPDVVTTAQGVACIRSELATVR